MPTKMIDTKFWTETQNNSGGRFDHKPEYGIGYALCVEAVDADDARRRMEAIVDAYPASGSCPCCGDRWGIYVYGDGNEQPSLYDEPLKGGWGIPSYVHHIDGSVVEYPE